MPINQRTVRGTRLALGSVWFDTAFRSPIAMRGGQFRSPGLSHLTKSGVYHHQSGNVLQGEQAYELSNAQHGRGLAIRPLSKPRTPAQVAPRNEAACNRIVGPLQSACRVRPVRGRARRHRRKAPEQNLPQPRLPAGLPMAEVCEQNPANQSAGTSSARRCQSR